MPRLSDARVAARRDQVLELWVRGLNVTGIAKAVGADWQTVRRDLAVLGRRVVAETDVPVQLARLLRGAQAVEVAAWGERQLGLVLASQKTQVAVLQALQALDLAQRLEQLEAQVAALATAAPPAGMEGYSPLLPNGRHLPAV